MLDVLKEVIKDGFNKLKRNFVSSYLLVLVFLVFALSGIAVNINPNFSFFSLIFTFFITLPILFSIVVSLYGLRLKINGLRWNNIFRYFLSYFKSPFRGVLRIIASIGVGVITYLLLSLIFSTIGYNITCSIYPEFPQIIEELYTFLQDTSADLNAFMAKYDTEINTFFYYTNSPAFIISLTVSILFSLYNLFYGYFLITFPLPHKGVARMCYRSGAHQSRKFILKDYLLISIPLILLFTGGYIVSLIICFNNNISYFLANTISLMVGVGIGSLYLPFFLSFIESLYTLNIDFYNPEKNDYTKDLINTLNEHLKLENEYLKKLNEIKDQIEQEKVDQHDDEKEK